jgi:hypothetical protein
MREMRDQGRPMKAPMKQQGDTATHPEKEPKDDLTDAERKLLEPEKEGGIGGP